MLAEAGALDFGDLVLHAFRLLREKPHVRARLRARATATCWSTSSRTRTSPRACCCGCSWPSTGNVTAVADDDQAIYRFRGAATKNIHDFRAEWPRRDGRARWRSSFRCAGARPRAPRRRSSRRSRTGSTRSCDGAAGGEVAFWRCANERAQAQAVAAEVERLIAREDVAPEDVCVLVRSVQRRGPGGRAWRSRSARCPYRLVGAAAFFQRAEVRDLLAWLRLLVDPGDAGAVVRALARPPVELRAIDLARVTQIARRRKLDMVAGAASPRWSRRRSRPRRASAIAHVPQAVPLRRRRARLHAGPTSSCTG